MSNVISLADFRNKSKTDRECEKLQRDLTAPPENKNLGDKAEHTIADRKRANERILRDLKKGK